MLILSLLTPVLSVCRARSVVKSCVTACVTAVVQIINNCRSKKYPGISTSLLVSLTSAKCKGGAGSCQGVWEHRDAERSHPPLLSERLWLMGLTFNDRESHLKQERGDGRVVFPCCIGSCCWARPNTLQPGSSAAPRSESEGAVPRCARGAGTWNMTFTDQLILPPQKRTHRPAVTLLINFLCS